MTTGASATVTEHDIDQLYQVPLTEFTAARAALANRAGRRSAEIKKLEKPNAAAWGVNQLYWRRRKTVDRLLATFERARAAQANLVAGRSADLAQAEVAHQSALDSAVDEVRALLSDAGDAASAATISAVVATLHALPFASMKGRLTRPLGPVGFGALAGMMGIPASPSSRLTNVVSIAHARRTPRGVASTAASEAKKHAADARREEVARVEFDLHAARSAERDAATRAAKAQADAGRAKEEHERARAELDDANRRVRERYDTAEQAAGEARVATAARKKCEARLARLQHSKART